MRTRYNFRDFAIAPDPFLMTRSQSVAAGPKGSDAQFSTIRTVTVGSGISPDLLTLDHEALAGFDRRWGLSPRPENGFFYRGRWVMTIGG